MSSIERRFITPEVEIRGDASNAPRFVGKAISYNSRTSIGNPATFGFFEEIAPGAAARSIGADDIAFLVNHSTMHVVSRTGAQSLALRDDVAGVFVDSALEQELSYVKDLAINLRNGNIRGMSFGFTVPKGGDEWKTVELEARDDKGEVVMVEAELRVIHDLNLMEVSAVTFPAYTDTEASMRDCPVLAERRDKYQPPSAKPEVDSTARLDRIARRARFLAARYNLPTEARGEHNV